MGICVQSNIKEARAQHLLGPLSLSPLRRQQTRQSKMSAAARNEGSTSSSTSEFDGITWPDYLVIVAYFLFVLAVGLYVCTVQTGYKIAAYKVKSAMKLLYQSPNMPLKSKLWFVIR